MNRIIPLFLGIALLCPVILFSQPCGFDQQIDHRNQKDPDFLPSLKAQELTIKSFRKRHSRSLESGIVTIPVVVHILHTGQPIGGPVNISDAQIHSAIDRLNKAFNGEAFYTTPQADIRFELAKRTPDCSVTNGIIRVNAKSICSNNDCYASKGITQANEAVLKGTSIWPTKDYLNIWVVREIEDNGAKNGIQGYAQFPGGDPTTDGVVILYNAFGYQEDAKGPFVLKTNTRLGTVLIHEVGHALGLYHSFEGDDYNRDGIGDRCPSFTGCGPFNGDCIDDTPPHRRSLGTCKTAEINVCDGGYPGDLFVHNFMDYSSEACQYEFTQGQVDRMNATLQTLRPGWVTSMGTLPVSSGAPALASCQPQTRYLPNNYGLGILEFKFGDFDIRSGNTVEDGGYVDNWCSTINAEAAKTYDIYINTGNQNAQNVKVFADYNGDGDFNDPNEEIFSSEKQKIHQGKVTVPPSAKSGKPLRVRSVSSYTGFKISGPCFEPYFGQVEDYSMIIGTPPLAAPQDLTNTSAQGENFSFAIAESEGYQVFPNPSSAQVVHVLSNSGDHVKRMDLYDASGHLLQRIKPDPTHSQRVNLELTDITPGIYYLKITDDHGVSVKRLSRI